jgi:AI-2 transport protein TqsA
MIEQITSFRGMRILIGTAALVIIIAGIYLAQSVLVLVLISFFLALLGTPSVLWLKEKRIPSAFAVLIVMAGMIIILIIIGAQIGVSISNFLDELPLLQTRLQEQVMELSAFLRSKGYSGTQKFLMDYVNPEAVMKLTAGLLS